MVSDNCPLGAKHEVHREVIADLKLVYYRGRFRASTAWSRVGKGRGAEVASAVEPDVIRKVELAARSLDSRQGLRPVAQSLPPF
jgi:hypothetical protein